MKKRSLLLILVSLVGINGIILTFQPKELLRQSSSQTVTTLLGAFEITSLNLVKVAELLSYENYNFGQHYFIPEFSPERLPLLESHVGDSTLHETIFALPKLWTNPSLAKAIFLNDNVSYGVNIWSDQLSNSINHQQAYFKDGELQKALIRHALTQLSKIETTKPLEEFLSFCRDEEAIWLFCKLALFEMTPNFMQAFLRLSSISLNFIIDYLNMNAAEASPIVRAILLHLAATAAAQDLNENIKKLAFARLKELSLVPENVKYPSLIDYGLLIEALLENKPKLTGRPYWATLAGIILSPNNKLESTKIIDTIQVILFEAPKGSVPPYLTRALLEEYGKKGQLISKISSRLPWNYHPLRMQPVSSRLKAWFHSAPLQLAKTNHDSPIDMNLCLTLAQSAYTSKQLFLNIKVKVPMMAESSREIIRDISDVIIDLSSKKLSKAVKGPLDLALIFAAWPYLLYKGEKIDIKRIFPVSFTDISWEFFYKKFSGYGQEYEFAVRESIRNFKFETFFNPYELRKLIDSSFDVSEL